MNCNTTHYRANSSSVPGDPTKSRIAAGDPFPGVGRTYKPDEAIVPGFLPELPEVRSEMAEYFTNVHRCDETVGKILQALDESGLADNTLVMFLSDNGISQPFAKSNCYLTSTRTPWIVRWPGKIKAGQVDSQHMISGIDFLPTILDAVGLAPDKGCDGRTFLPVLTAGNQDGRDQVVTCYTRTSGGRDYPMRCIQDRYIGYIYNAWSDGKTVYQAEPLGGRAFAAMRNASDRAVQQRVKMVQYRVPEELYDLEADPSALKNLVNDPQHAAKANEMRAKLLKWMEDVNDPLLPQFKKQLGRASGDKAAPARR